MKKPTTSPTIVFMRIEKINQGFPRPFTRKKLPNPLNSKLKKRDGKSMVAHEESNPYDVSVVAGVAQDSQNTTTI